MANKKLVRYSVRDGVKRVTVYKSLKAACKDDSIQTGDRLGELEIAQEELKDQERLLQKVEEFLSRMKEITGLLQAAGL